MTAISTQIASSKSGALAALSLAMLLSSLGTSIANVALPTLADTFGAAFPAVQWVVLAYLLATTALIVGVGRLGDLFGRRRLLLAGILVFTAASLLCGAAPSLGLLIAARAFQGLGAAVLMALTLAFAGELAPPARTGSTMGLLGTMSAVGTALGPSLGGVLIAGFGWRAIFFCQVPLGLVAWLLAWRFLPRDRPAAAAAKAFDAAGTLLLALALAAYALAATLGRGRFGLASLGLLAVAVVIGFGFVRVEAKAAAPLLHLASFRDRGLAGGLGASLLVSTVMMGTLVVGPFYLARALALDPAQVGVAMSAGPLVAALAGWPAGRLVDRRGAGPMTRLGLAGLAAGCAALALLPERLGLAGYLGPVAVVTAAYALFQAANNTAVMARAGAERRGVTSGLLNLSRNLGLVTGAALLGAVFAGAAGSDLAAAPPAAVAAGMRTTFGVAALLMAAALAIRPAAADASTGSAGILPASSP